MISNIPSVNRSPADVTSDTEHQHSDDIDEEEGGSEEEEEESDENKSDTEEGEEVESSPSEVVPRECRAKEKNDPSARTRGARVPSDPRPTASASSRGAKRLRAEAVDSVEKQSKQPK